MFLRSKEKNLVNLSPAQPNEGDPIPAEDLPHIFDRFYRVDKARTNDGDSHGLGLAIAYGIAQEHGGKLEASSTAENGTTFTARLPL